MKVFICAFSGFYVAIPMSSVASLTDLTTTVQGAVITRCDADTHVSLPLLFNLPQEKLRHGIVLKNPDDHVGESKLVLLSTEVVNTSEIPDEKMYPIPRVLNGTQFATMFSGMQCAAEATRDAGLVILLDPDRLIQYARQEVAE
ncbi:MAG: hypothetical protein FWB78_07290 [Treponema sp.]|nr:hypothetical protein [Treponema sp.]